VRSQDSKYHLRLITKVHEGIQLTRLREDGVAVFEVSDPDLELELIFKKRKPPMIVGGGDKEGNKGNDTSQPRTPLNDGGISKHADTAQVIKVPSGGKAGDNLKSKSSTRPRKRAAVSCASAKVHKKQKNAATDAVVVSRDEAEKKSNVTDDSSDCLKDESKQVEEGETKATSSNSSSGCAEEKLNSAEDHLSKAEAITALTALADNDDPANPKPAYDAKLDLLWESHYKNLVAYKLEHGDCTTLKANAGMKLRRWVVRQKRDFRRGKMPKNRATKLIDIGVLKAEEDENYIPRFGTNKEEKESVHDLKWEMKYKKLLSHKDEHGHFDDLIKTDRKLHEWMRREICVFRKCHLPEKRAEKLKDIGLLSAEELENYKSNKPESNYDQRMNNQWNARFNELWAYTLKTGKKIVDKHDNYPLAQWIGNQRAVYRDGNMCQERIHKLKEIGMLTPPARTKKVKVKKKEINWCMRYNQLVEYKKEKGHCRISKEAYPGLNKWANRQTKKFREGSLSDDKAAKLKEIGYLTEEKCKPKEDQDMVDLKCYKLLVDYKNVHGDCKVPQENTTLSKWVHTQRNKQRKGNLSDEMYSKLEEIGFVWNLFEEKWNAGYTDLMHFKQEHGHCLVPVSYKPCPNLRKWVGYQRTKYRQGILSAIHKTQLDDLGFVWDVGVPSSTVKKEGTS